MTHRNCESLKEIGEMTCVTPAWSSRAQTYRSSFWGTISYFSFRVLWFANDIAPLPIFFVVWIELFEENPRKFHFHQPRLVPALLLPNDIAENFPRFLLLCFLSIRSCSFNVIAAIVKVFRSPGSRGPRSDLVLVPWSRVGWGRFPVSVKLFIQLPRSKSLSTVP